MGFNTKMKVKSTFVLIGEDLIRLVAQNNIYEVCQDINGSINGSSERLTFIQECAAKVYLYRILRDWRPSDNPQTACYDQAIKMLIQTAYSFLEHIPLTTDLCG